MALRSQKQVMKELDGLAGRAVGRASKGYRNGIQKPLADTIAVSKSLKDLQRRLGPGLLRRMDSEQLETSLADGMTQANLVGQVSATPMERKDDRG